MTTRHEVYFRSAADLSPLENASIALVVTSPPYPMIEMWDETFSAADPAIAEALRQGAGARACELMHHQLDEVWRECYRVLTPGGFACINIGDATRTLDNTFQLHTNHSRITVACERIGFLSLPAILWRKQTNAPNKFMGSGMLPAGAYVTLEHEYILVFRKGGKRVFSPEEALQRRRSAFFRHERNTWFSDLWDFKGVQQRLGAADLRTRSGAFPLELPFRLINMYSLQGETVLDPFSGTGTTHLAAIAAGRNSRGFEIDPAFAPSIERQLTGNTEILRERQQRRLREHREYVRTARNERGYRFRHWNEHLNLPVMTGQETELWIPQATGVEAHPRADGAPLVVTASYTAADDSTDEDGQLGLNLEG